MTWATGTRNNKLRAKICKSNPWKYACPPKGKSNLPTKLISSGFGRWFHGGFTWCTHTQLISTKIFSSKILVKKNKKTPKKNISKVNLFPASLGFQTPNVRFGMTGPPKTYHPNTKPHPGDSLKVTSGHVNSPSLKKVTFSPVDIGSLSHYLQDLYIPGGISEPSTVWLEDKRVGFESEWLLALDAIQKVPDASKKASQTSDATGSSLPAGSPPNKNMPQIWGLKWWIETKGG